MGPRRKSHAGPPLRSHPPQTLLVMDASTKGWGAHLKDLKISGMWDSQEKKSHINQLEMTAVLKALVRFAPFIVGQKIGLMSDNSTVVAYLNK